MNGGSEEGRWTLTGDGIIVAKVEDHADLHRKTGGSDMKLTTVGVDIAKSVMQLHYVDAETGEIVNKPVKRVAFLEHREGIRDGQQE